jgi:outer membrane protein OmpA-like peptidoglycan-associated protein
MARKILSCLLGILFVLVLSASAQYTSGGGYDVMDSSVIPVKRLPQHTEFLAHNYAFPALPRNQWELGVKLGAASISGDVRSLFPGFGAGFHVRKAVGYVLSVRGELGYGVAKGLNYSPSTGYRRNSAWAPKYAPGGVTPTKVIYYNYKTNVFDFSLQAVAAFNNIRFHRANTKMSIYAFAGLGGFTYDTKIDALNGSSVYNFSSITAAGQFSKRRDTRKALKNLLDGNYETKGETDALQPKLFGRSFKPSMPVGFGVQMQLNNKISLSIEERYNVVKSDLLDGQQWQEGNSESPAQTRDYDTYNFFSLGLNYTVGTKSVQPLWWLNPLDYAYNEINKPRHMQLPKPVLDDKDGDGVTDQFDKEPNTPAGAPVDSHGVSKDTDGDGVPDYKDKELITPTQCQPVDADGVGKCPEPACCKDIRVVEKPTCAIGSLPSITFKGKTVTLSREAKALLANVAQRIRDNAACKVAVVGYCSSSKSEQQLSWDRVNAIINYLVDNEAISSDRFVFKYGQEGGDCNTVDLMDGTDDVGPNSVPAPHPNLRRKG